MCRFTKQSVNLLRGLQVDYNSFFNFLNFPACSGYWQVLGDCQYLPRLFLCFGHTVISLTLLALRSNRPARARIRSISVTFSRDKWHLRRWLLISCLHSRRKINFSSPLFGPQCSFKTTEKEQVFSMDIILLESTLFIDYPLICSVTKFVDTVSGSTWKRPNMATGFSNVVYSPFLLLFTLLVRAFFNRRNCWFDYLHSVHGTNLGNILGVTQDWGIEPFCLCLS